MYDLVLKGGRVVDGTGLPAFTADIAVKDGRVAKIGRVERRRARHARLPTVCSSRPASSTSTRTTTRSSHWDPTASPASWHGVTTFMTGNCGFTLAPAKPDDRRWLLQMLSRVEGMSADALAAGVDFAGGSLGDFLATSRAASA